MGVIYLVERGLRISSGPTPSGITFWQQDTAVEGRKKARRKMEE